MSLKATSGRATRRSQAERSASSDERLLKAATEIIAEEGYLSATLERVGARAGFSRGLASRKYGSKDGLIQAVIWRVSAEVHGQMDAALADCAEPLEQLLRLVDRFIELVLTDTSVRAYFVLFSAMIANRLDTRSDFEGVQQAFAERIEALIRAAQDAGSVDRALPSGHGAYLVGCLLAGISIESEMTPGLVDPVQAEPLRHSLCAMLRRALSAP